MSDRQEGWYWILIEGGIPRGSGCTKAPHGMPLNSSSLTLDFDVQVLSDRLVPPNEAEPIAS